MRDILKDHLIMLIGVQKLRKKRVPLVLELKRLVYVI